MNGCSAPPYARRSVASDPRPPRPEFVIPASATPAPTARSTRAWDAFVGEVRGKLEPAERPVFDGAVAKLTDERRAALMAHCPDAAAAVRVFRGELGRPTSNGDRSDVR